MTTLTEEHQREYKRYLEYGPKECRDDDALQRFMDEVPPAFKATDEQKEAYRKSQAIKEDAEDITLEQLTKINNKNLAQVAKRNKVERESHRVMPWTLQQWRRKYHPTTLEQVQDMITNIGERDREDLYIWLDNLVQMRKQPMTEAKTNEED